MKEYKQNGHILISLDSPIHEVHCQSAEEAHQFRLALGLGTHPDPMIKADYYQQLEKGVFRPLRPISIQDNIDEGMSCCESGCSNCPWGFSN